MGNYKLFVSSEIQTAINSINIILKPIKSNKIPLRDRLWRKAPVSFKLTCFQGSLSAAYIVYCPVPPSQKIELTLILSAYVESKEICAGNERRKVCRKSSFWDTGSFRVDLSSRYPWPKRTNIQERPNTSFFSRWNHCTDGERAFLFPRPPKPVGALWAATIPDNSVTRDCSAIKYVYF